MTDTPKMDERTLIALRGSIEKWEKIVAGTGEDLLADNCPLCKLFTDDEDAVVLCNGCPVRDASGFSCCVGTPWQKWDRNVGRWDQHQHRWTRFADTPELVALAQAELDFLRSLLPEGERE